MSGNVGGADYAIVVLRKPTPTGLSTSVRRWLYEPIYITLCIISYIPIISIHTHINIHTYICSYIAIIFIYNVGTLFSYQATNPTAFQVTDTGQYNIAATVVSPKSHPLQSIHCVGILYTSQRYTNTRLQKPLPV